MIGVEFIVVAMEGLLRVYADVACGCPEQESLAKPSFFESPTPSKPYISPLSQPATLYSRLSGGIFSRIFALFILGLCCVESSLFFC